MMAPAGNEIAMDLLGRLAMAGVPMPADKRTNNIYLEHLDKFPADVLGRVVERLIDEHKWNTVPLIGDIVSRCRADDSYQERRRVMTRIGMVEQRLVRIERRPAPALAAPPSPASIAKTMRPFVPKEPTEAEAEADLRRRQAKLNKEMKDAGLI